MIVSVCGKTRILSVIGSISSCSGRAVSGPKRFFSTATIRRLYAFPLVESEARTNCVTMKAICAVVGGFVSVKKETNVVVVVA